MDARPVILDDRYELLDELGSGGYGIVYKARQLNTGQHVAIKLAHVVPDDDRAALAARFQREMAAVATLSHPNIVRLIDTGQLPDRRLYTVLEYVPGVTLGERLRRDGPMAPGDALRLMSQVLDALSSAHARGVIHRDLKPSNIMITEGSALQNAMVLDFSIAGLVKDAHTDRSPLTPVGTIGGTPAYMAPEQFEGGVPTGQSDIYAWGLVFTECLTGERVIRGNLVAIMRAHMQPHPHPVPAHIADHPLGRILRRAMAKNLDVRYVRASDALSALMRCNVSNVPTLPRPPSTSRAEAHHSPRIALGSPRESRTGAVDTHTTISRFQLGTSVSGVTDEPSSDELAVTPASAIAAERRQITAMACELGPLTALSENAGPDEIYARLRQFRQLVEDVVREFGGSLAARIEGNRLMAYFGYPRAHEDDALRAVEAGRTIAHRLRLHPANTHTPPVDICIGIHTGLVVSRRDPTGHASGGPPDVSIIGNVTRVAETAQEQAELGALVVTRSVTKQIRDRFDCQSIGDHRLGLHGAVTLYRVIGPADATPTPTRRLALPAIGRDSELASLHDRWEEACDGRGQVVFITGAAGIGKSHLLRQFQGRLNDRSHFWLDCTSSPFLQSSAFHPVIHGMRGLIGLRPSDRAARDKLARFLTGQRDDRLAEFCASFLDVTGHSPADPTLSGAASTPPEERLIDLMFALADTRPLVIVFEDLHWADRSTHELVTALVDQAPVTRMMVIVSTRPTYVPAWRARSHIIPLALTRLPRKRAYELVRAIAGAKALPDALVEHLVDKTDGVPLFIEELTKAVLESTVVTERADRYELTGDVRTLPIPVTLRGSLMERLDRLGDAKQVAQIAATIGREFDFGLLKQVADLPGPELRHRLRQLVDAELIIQRGRPPDARYIFKHAMIQDTAYESLLDKTRRAYHARIAETLDRLVTSQTGELGGSHDIEAEFVAYQFGAARRYEQASDYWLRAGNRSSELGAYTESIQHLRRGLDLLTAHVPASAERDRKELRLLMSLGAPLLFTKGYSSTEIETTCTRALALCRELGEDAQQTPFLWFLWLFFHVRADFANSRELSRRLCRAAEQTGASEVFLCGHMAAGSDTLLLGEIEHARALLESGIAVYDPDEHGHLAVMYSHDPGMYCHIFMAWALLAQARSDRAAEHCETSIALARRAEHPASLVFALCMSQPVYRARGELDRVRALGTEATALSREHRLPHWLAFVGFMHGAVRAELGELDAGIADMSQSLGEWRVVGTQIILPYFYSQFAEYLSRTGAVEHALEVQATVPPNNLHRNERLFEPNWLTVRAQLLARRDPGDLAEPLALLDQALACARECGHTLAELAALVSLLELDGAGDMDRSRVDAARSRLAMLCAELDDSLPLLSRARALLF